MDNSKKSSDHLSDHLEVQRQALLLELELVHTAIGRISERGQASEDTRRWVEKLKSWHAELHDLIDRIPKKNQQ